MEELLSITDIVREYKVSRKTVQRWVNAVPQRIHPVKTLTGKTGAHLFTREEADNAFAAHRDEKIKKMQEVTAE